MSVASSRLPPPTPLLTDRRRVRRHRLWGIALAVLGTAAGLAWFCTAALVTVGTALAFGDGDPPPPAVGVVCGPALVLASLVAGPVHAVRRSLSLTVQSGVLVFCVTAVLLQVL